MVHLIDKDALVAEIERQKTIYNDDENINHVAKYNILVDILSFLDTLEVKEVDLEKEIDDYINEHFSECEDGVLISDANSKELTLLDIIPMARRFFETGFKQKVNKL